MDQSNGPMTPARVINEAEVKLLRAIREHVVRFNNETGCTLTSVHMVYNRYTQDVVELDTGFITEWDENDGNLQLRP